MRVYLIRHGETEYNRQQIMQGHSEVPLNERGVDQVTRLARRMKDVPVDAIYASDLRRTVMTADILAEYTGAPVTYDALFRERDPGDLTNRTYAEAQAFFLDPTYEPPNGESETVFRERVKEAFRRLVERESGPNRNVAVVSHGMVCRAFVQSVVADPAIDSQAVAWPNASVTIAQYQQDQWRVDLLADAAHLDTESAHPTDKTGA